MTVYGFYPVSQKIHNSQFTIINYQLSIFNSQLIPLRGLFLLAARHSANKFALCTRSAASVLSFQFSVFNSQLSTVNYQFSINPPSGSFPPPCKG